MSKKRQQLLAIIEKAFHKVELGAGVSLHETVVIDDYGTPEERQAARRPDEKQDWRRLINNPELTRITGIGGLSFYDAAGFRFHLPAYLSLAVIDFDGEHAGNAMESLMYHLTDFSDYNLGRFSILNNEQRQCVRSILIFIRDQYEYELGGTIDQAIQGYWSSGLRQ